MYDGIARGYNELHGEEQRRKLRKLLAHVELKPRMSVADIGCGTAHLAPFFAKQRYVGVDPSEGLLRYTPEHVDTVLARGEELPFGAGRFDIVLSLTALHNYGDWEKGVSELDRIAKGLVLVGVLKKAAAHDAIVSHLRRSFHVIAEERDQHDTLLVLRKRR